MTPPNSKDCLDKYVSIPHVVGTLSISNTLNFITMDVGSVLY